MTEENKKINTGRRNFIKYGIAGAIGVGVASAVDSQFLPTSCRTIIARLQP